MWIYGYNKLTINIGWITLPNNAAGYSYELGKEQD